MYYTEGLIILLLIILGFISVFFKNTFLSVSVLSNQYGLVCLICVVKEWSILDCVSFTCNKYEKSEAILSNITLDGLSANKYELIY